jgi:general L-amino acid transport system substrate-binding protein
MRNLLIMTLLLAAVFSGISTQSVSAASTLDLVRKRGHLTCGVNPGRLGFAVKVDGKGWQGFDVDFCRAVAAAVLGDASKVKFVPLQAPERFKALTSGKVDLLSRNTTWTMRRDIVLDVDFVGTTYFDGQGFMVPKALGLASATKLGNRLVCALRGTTVEVNTRRFFAKHDIPSKILLFDTREELTESYDAGGCNVYVDDISALGSERVRLKEPDAHVFLSDFMAKEPLGPVVRASDSHWRQVVQWVLFLLINAEEAGWTSADVVNKATDRPLEVSVPQDVTAKMRLRVEWPDDVISQLGNYKEIFERNLGPNSPLKMSRGFNALWIDGGILYAPPIR